MLWPSIVDYCILYLFMMTFMWHFHLKLLDIVPNKKGAFTIIKEDILDKEL